MADKVEDETRDESKRSVDLSRIKNKIKRSVLYKQEKNEKNIEKREKKNKRKREEEELGDDVRYCHMCISVSCQSESD